ncbi:MAG: dipeptide/oligopeptide/nickel ABC transporter permease/ATP-binding protein [Actinomycetota bacterium]|nr:dipeptide/oligopeptide/nickel ABC transporter permease/ATP-binding protein [Actinomycetota bacterium]
MTIAVEETPANPIIVQESLIRRVLRSPLAVVCLIYLSAIVVVAVVAPFMMPEVGTTNAGNLSDAGQGPSPVHWLGTDDLGRDVLDRLLVGTRVTFIAVVEAVVVAVSIGVPLGLCAGFFGGLADRIVSWMGDLLLAIPGVAMMLVVLAVFPGNTFAAMLAFGVLVSPMMMRVVRSAALPIREENYVAAAHVSGLSRPRILTRHVMPRIGGVVIVQCSLMAGQALLAMSGLAFLGLIAEAPAPSWGGMVGDGFRVMIQQPWLIWPSGLIIAITVLAFGLLGDILRDAAAGTWSSSPASNRQRGRRTLGSAAEQPSNCEGALLDVRDVHVQLHNSGSKARTVLDGVSFQVRAGESVAVVGESGCGKSITALTILGLLPGAAYVESGSVWFDGTDLTALDEAGLRKVRGKRIGFISQEPMVSLNPAFSVGSQLAEIVRRHHYVSRREVRARVLDLLRKVHLPDPEAVAKKYPHELSGGMAQRVSIARALAGSPVLLIADEPTTALDVTVQSGILDLFRELQDEGMALMFVTHDWGVAADMCDRAIVMYAGQVVEQAEMEVIVEAPRHPYTAALLSSDPHRQVDGSGRLPTIPGTVPQPGAWPVGCHFKPRCHLATDDCAAALIPMVEVGVARESRCLRVDELVGQLTASGVSSGQVPQHAHLEEKL